MYHNVLLAVPDIDGKKRSRNKRHQHHLDVANKPVESGRAYKIKINHKYPQQCTHNLSSYVGYNFCKRLLMETIC